MLVKGGHRSFTASLVSDIPPAVVKIVDFVLTMDKCAAWTDFKSRFERGKCKVGDLQES